MRLFHGLALATLLTGSASADVTLRYRNEVKFNPNLPPQMREAAAKGMSTGLPPETVFQWKGGKGATAFGPFRSVVDVTKKQLTMWDPAEKKVAIASSEALAAEIGKVFDNMPPEAKAALAAMKVTVDAKPTGKTREVKGIQADEREVALSIEGPPIPNMPPGPMMKMEITFWTAKEEEVGRVPALRELREYNLWSLATMNPAGSLERMFQTMPGMGDGLGKMMLDMQTAKAVMLGSKITMWMPGLAAMMKMAPPGQNPLGENFDANAPFAEVTQELAELSTTPVPDSVFTVPEGYTATSLPDLMKSMMTKGTPAQ